MELAFFTVKVLLDQRAMLICESMMTYDTCSQSLRPALHQVKMPVVLKGHLAEELLKMEEPKVQS